MGGSEGSCRNEVILLGSLVTRDSSPAELCTSLQASHNTDTNTQL